MKLELKCIVHHKRLSQETPAYKARLYLDDVAVADVCNHGCGGCDSVIWRDQSAEKKITDHFKALPKLTFGGIEIEQDLELWCHSRVEEITIIRAIRGVCNRKIFGITVDGRELTFSPPLRDLTRVRPEIEKRHPGIAILNGASDSEILAAARRVTF